MVSVIRPSLPTAPAGRIGAADAGDAAACTPTRQNRRFPNRGHRPSCAASAPWQRRFRPSWAEWLGNAAGRCAGLVQALRLLGQGNLSVGRLYEAHVNALRLWCGSALRTEGTRQRARRDGWSSVWPVGHGRTPSAPTTARQWDPVRKQGAVFRRRVRDPSLGDRAAVFRRIAHADHQGTRP